MRRSGHPGQGRPPGRPQVRAAAVFRRRRALPHGHGRRAGPPRAGRRWAADSGSATSAGIQPAGGFKTSGLPASRSRTPDSLSGWRGPDRSGSCPPQSLPCGRLWSEKPLAIDKHAFPGAGIDRAGAAGQLGPGRSADANSSANVEGFRAWYRASGLHRAGRGYAAALLLLSPGAALRLRAGGLLGVRLLPGALRVPRFPQCTRTTPAIVRFTDGDDDEWYQPAFCSDSCKSIRM